MFTRFILALSLVFNTQAFAQVNVIKPDIIETYTGVKNYIANPSATVNLRFTATSNATLTRDTDSGDRLNGVASFLCDTSATNGFCDWDTTTIVAPDTVGQCEAKAVYKGDASLYVLRLTDGTNTLADSRQLINASDWTEVSIQYPCGTTRDVRLVQNTAGTSGAVNIGAIHYGKSTSIRLTNSPELISVVTWAATSNCYWTTNSNSFTQPSADTDCPNPTIVGAGTIAGTKIPAFTLPELPVGFYEITLIAPIVNESTGAGITDVRFGVGSLNTANACNYYSAANGFNQAGCTQSVNVTTPQTNITVNIQLRSGSTAYNSAIDGRFYSPTLIIKRYPSASETVVRTSLNALNPAGEVMAFAGATCPVGWLAANGQAVSRATYYDLFSRISTAYGTGDGSTTFNVPDLRGQFLRGIMPIASQTASGSASSNNVTLTGHGYNVSGIPVRVTGTPVTGLSTSTTYWLIVVDANTVAFATTRANSLAGTKITISGSAASMSVVQYIDPDASSRLASAPGGNTGANVGTLQTDELKSHSHSYDAGGNSHFVLRTTGGALGLTSGSVQANSVTGTQSTGGAETRPSNIAVTYCVRAYDQSQAAPVLIGSPTSNSTSALRVETAVIRCTASSSISRKSSDWITIGNISTNRCALTFTSGFFSEAPTCTANVMTSITGLVVSTNLNISSATAGSIGAVSHSGSTTNDSTDTFFSIVCYGAR